MLEKIRRQVLGQGLFGVFFLQILTAISASAMVSVKCSSKLHSSNSLSTSAASASLGPQGNIVFSLWAPGLWAAVLLHHYYSPGSLPWERLQPSGTPQLY